MDQQQLIKQIEFNSGEILIKAIALLLERNIGFHRIFDFYGSEYWKEIARDIRKRDGNMCQICNTNGKLHVHHITPISEGGTEDYENLITLCASCHMGVHNAR